MNLHHRTYLSDLRVCLQHGDKVVCDSIRRIRHFLAADLAQRISCRSLFGFFFVAAPGGLVAVNAELGGNFEALAVVGAFFI